MARFSLRREKTGGSSNGGARLFDSIMHATRLQGATSVMSRYFVNFWTRTALPLLCLCRADVRIRFRREFLAFSTDVSQRARGQPRQYIMIPRLKVLVAVEQLLITGRKSGVGH